MQARIVQIKKALHSAAPVKERIVQLEQQLTAVSLHGSTTDSLRKKILVNKPDTFNGS